MTEADWFTAVDPAPLLRFVGDGLTDRHQLLFMAGCCRRVWDLLTDDRFRRVVEVAEAVAEGRATATDLTAAAEELPRPGRRQPPPPDPLMQEAETIERRTFYMSSALPNYGERIDPRGGVLNFHDLPTWCQQTYHAVAAIAPRNYLTVAECCENAAAHHAGDGVAERHPLHEEVRQLRDEVRREYLKAGEYRWRGADRLHEEQVAAAQVLEHETEERVQKLTNEIWSAGQDERITRAAAERAAQTDLVRCVCGNPFRPITADPSWLTSTVVALVRGVHEERAFDRLPILADALQDAGCADADVLAHCREPRVHTLGCWVVDLLRPRPRG